MAIPDLVSWLSTNSPGLIGPAPPAASPTAMDEEMDENVFSFPVGQLTALENSVTPTSFVSFLLSLVVNDPLDVARHSHVPVHASVEGNT